MFPKIYNLREIVIEWLKQNKYDGLRNSECGCGIDYLMPCDNPCQDCTAAFKCRVKTVEACDTCGSREFCESLPVGDIVYSSNPSGCHALEMVGREREMKNDIR